MSAGLAHELNNPSSAAQRIAVDLGEVIQTIQSVAHRLHHALEHEHWDRLIALVDEVLKNPLAGKQHYSFEQSDSEDALTAWLREGGVSDAWKIAPVLVGAGLEMSALVSLRELLPKNAFGDAVGWIALRLKIQTLLDDAEQSTGRIASLVEAVRSIADRSARRPRILTCMSNSEARWACWIANSRTFVSPRIFRANPVTCAAIRANSRRCGSTCSIMPRMP